MTKRRKPEQIADVLAQFLGREGLAGRIEQAGVIPDWPTLVGERISAVTAPTAVSADGTLFVQVTTNAWMNELSLMEPELLRRLNEGSGRSPIRRIRWQLKR